MVCLYWHLVIKVGTKKKEQFNVKYDKILRNWFKKKAFL